MKCHVELVARTKICAQIAWPLVRFRQQHAAGKFLIEPGAQFLDHRMRFRQVLAVGALALHQIRHCVEPESIHPHVQPEAHHVPHLFADIRIVVI